MGSHVPIPEGILRRGHHKARIRAIDQHSASRYFYFGGRVTFPDRCLSAVQAAFRARCQIRLGEEDDIEAAPDRPCIQTGQI